MGRDPTLEQGQSDCEGVAEVYCYRLTTTLIPPFPYTAWGGGEEVEDGG